MTIRIKIHDVLIYLMLTFAVLIPLFVGRYLFILDLIPRINDYQISNFFYGRTISQYGGNILLVAISIIIKEEIFQKIMLFFILFMSGYSMHNLMCNSTSSRIAQFYAGLLYMFNPYTYVRVMTGQLFLLYSYAILPILLKTFIDLLEKKDNKEMIKFIFFLSFTAFNIHMLIIASIMITIIFLLWFNKYRDIRVLKLIIFSGILFILLMSYWIIPLITTKNTLVDNIGDKDFETFSSKGGLFDIISMYGFWRGEYLYIRDFLPEYQFLSLIIMSLAILGFISYYKNPKIGVYILAFAVIGILGSVLAFGIKGPLPDIVLKGFRDDHKFVAMLVISYSFLGALGIEKIKNCMKLNRWKEIKYG